MTTAEALAGRVVTAGELTGRLAAHRARHERVVFTNGCFDVLHHGHVRYLAEARRLGDVLVVAVNSDAGVRRLKGTDRPVNPLADRVAVLAALRCVDYVVAFDEDTPVRLLRRARPDCYVKGGDYAGRPMPEREVMRRLGGEVRVLGYLGQRSTSRIIDRIRRRA